MADNDKKKEGSNLPFDIQDPVGLLVILIVGAMIIGALIESIRRFIFSSEVVGARESVLDYLISLRPLAQVISAVISAFAIVGLFVLARKIGALRAREREQLYPFGKEDGPLMSDLQEETPAQKKWKRILGYVESDSLNDWKLAIIEADILLDELLDVLGYQGETMADKLKQIEKSDFLTLDLAWEAHKVRNEIAHRGGDFLLTERETRRVIDLYRQVFEEFRFV